MIKFFHPELQYFMKTTSKNTHHGRLLKSILTLNNIKPKKLAALLQTSEVTVFRWFQKESFPNDRILALKQVGIDLNEGEGGKSLPTQQIIEKAEKAIDMVTYLKEKFEDCQQRLQDKEDMILLLKDRLAQYEKN